VRVLSPFSKVSTENTKFRVKVLAFCVPVVRVGSKYSTAGRKPEIVDDDVPNGDST